MGLILDTNFLISFERETRRRLAGAAVAFLSNHRSEEMYVPFVVAGEIACGRPTSESAWLRLLSHFKTLPWKIEISWKYGEIYNYLAAQGMLIGPNDLWIAATALVNSMPLVTNNTSEFSRVPGLTVFGF